MGETLIGTASYFKTYVFIECPLPWAAKVFSSEGILVRLRQYIKALKDAIKTAAQSELEYHFASAHRE